MRHLALNVYVWGDSEQERLLTDCLGPTARELWDAGRLRRFWVHRFDARGPHVTALLGAPAEHAEEVRRRVDTRLGRHLLRSPSTALLAPAELQERHDACRGSRLTSLDALPGFAENNSYAFADQPADAYPFGRVAGTAEAAEMERLLGEQTFWSVEQLRAGTAALGPVRWVAALDRGIARAGADPVGFWRAYASTLFPSLRERIAGGDAEVAAKLGARIGERNRAVFGRIWPGDGVDAPTRARAERLAELALGLDARDPAHPWSFTRELTHAVLAQLGLPVMLRIPLILYAWLHDRPSAAHPYGSPA
jgi:hypothetical protein